MIKQMRRIIGLVLCAGCGDVDSHALDAAAGDALGDTQMIVDVPTGACNLNAPFAGAVTVAGATDVSQATITYDELVIYYQAAGGTIHRASRSSATGAFDVGGPAPGLGTGVYGPSPNQTDRILWLHTGSAVLFYTTRASTSADFGALTSTGITGAHCFASPHGLYWLFNEDLHRAPLNGTTVGMAARIDTLATAETETFPVVSADDQEIAFRRGTELVVARRPQTTSDFANPAVITTGVTFLHPVGFSGDRCRLYFTAQVGSNSGLFFASRP
jgi:hypothetical protein